MTDVDPALPTFTELAGDIARARRRYESVNVNGPCPITAYEPCEMCGRHVVGVRHGDEHFVAEAVAAIHDERVPADCIYRLRVRRHRCSGRPAFSATEPTP